MAKYVLIRHGESVWNGERRIQGNQDPSLSARGARQAEMLAASLSSRGLPAPGAIYASPLRRAAETAERIAAVWRVPVIREPDFREMALGQWESRTVAEIQRVFPGTYEQWLQDPLAHPAPGGEELGAFFRRVVGGFERMRAAEGDRDCCVVAHGGVTKALLCHILDLPIRLLFRFKQDNTAVNVVEVDGEVRRVVLANDTCHLTDAGADMAPRDVLTDATTPDATL